MQTLIKKIRAIPKAYVSFADIRKVASMGDASLRVAVSRLVKRGDLAAIGKGVFTYDVAAIDWEQFAVEQYLPSYISFESALARYSVLSQQPQGLTLATARRSKKVQTPFQMLFYRHIQSRLFWGYEKEGCTLIAELEKAFLDLLYLSLNGYATFDIEEMNCHLLDMKKVRLYAHRFQSKRLTAFLKKVLLLT